MGMSGRLTERWSEANQNYLAGNQRASDVAGGLGAIAKVLRMMLQSAVLAVGAYLVIHQEATARHHHRGLDPDARALAPVDLAIAHWKGFVAARRAGSASTGCLDAVTGRKPRRRSCRYRSSQLSVESVSIVPPGDQQLIVQDVTFALQAGKGLGVIGPSGSGKSSLVRALVGVWQPVRGKVRLDGASLDQWSSDVLGRHVGYLPQDVELFAGSVAQNIGRFDPEPRRWHHRGRQGSRRPRDDHQDARGLQHPGRRAGHRAFGRPGQRVALARALYGNPFLIVLDEPNSNLDTEGDEALTRAVRAARERGAIVVVVAHRPIGIEAVDQLLVLQDGRMQAFGPKEPCSRRCCSSASRRHADQDRDRRRSCQIMSRQRTAQGRAAVDPSAFDRRPCHRRHYGRRTRRLGIDGPNFGRADRAGTDRRRIERQESAASDRRRGRRSARP